jgi:hypothetical protein
VRKILRFIIFGTRLVRNLKGLAASSRTGFDTRG